MKPTKLLITLSLVAISAVTSVGLFLSNGSLAELQANLLASVKTVLSNSETPIRIEGESIQRGEVLQDNEILTPDERYLLRINADQAKREGQSFQIKVDAIAISGNAHKSFEKSFKKASFLNTTSSVITDPAVGSRTTRYKTMSKARTYSHEYICKAGQGRVVVTVNYFDEYYQGHQIVLPTAHVQCGNAEQSKRKVKGLTLIAGKTTYNSPHYTATLSLVNQPSDSGELNQVPTAIQVSVAKNDGNQLRDVRLNALHLEAHPNLKVEGGNQVDEELISLYKKPYTIALPTQVSCDWTGKAQLTAFIQLSEVFRSGGEQELDYLQVSSKAFPCEVVRTEVKGYVKKDFSNGGQLVAQSDEEAPYAKRYDEVVKKVREALEVGLNGKSCIKIRPPSFGEVEDEDIEVDFMCAKTIIKSVRELTIKEQDEILKALDVYIEGATLLGKDYRKRHTLKKLNEFIDGAIWRTVKGRTMHVFTKHFGLVKFIIAPNEGEREILTTDEAIEFIEDLIDDCEYNPTKTGWNFIPSAHAQAEANPEDVMVKTPCAKDKVDRQSNIKDADKEHIKQKVDEVSVSGITPVFAVINAISEGSNSSLGDLAAPDATASLPILSPLDPFKWNGNRGTEATTSDFAKAGEESVLIYILDDKGEPIKKSDGSPVTINVAVSGLFEGYGATCAVDSDGPKKTNWNFIKSAYASQARNSFESSAGVDVNCVKQSVDTDKRLLNASRVTVRRVLVIRIVPRANSRNVISAQDYLQAAYTPKGTSVTSGASLIEHPSHSDCEEVLRTNDKTIFIGFRAEKGCTYSVGEEFYVTGRTVDRIAKMFRTKPLANLPAGSLEEATMKIPIASQDIIAFADGEGPMITRPLFYEGEVNQRFKCLKKGRASIHINVDYLGRRSDTVELDVECVKPEVDPAATGTVGSTSTSDEEITFGEGSSVPGNIARDATATIDLHGSADTVGATGDTSLITGTSTTTVSEDKTEKHPETEDGHWKIMGQDAEADVLVGNTHTLLGSILPGPVRTALEEQFKRDRLSTPLFGIQRHFTEANFKNLTPEIIGFASTSKDAVLKISATGNSADFTKIFVCKKEGRAHVQVTSAYQGVAVSPEILGPVDYGWNCVKPAEDKAEERKQELLKLPEGPCAKKKIPEDYFLLLDRSQIHFPQFLQTGGGAVDVIKGGKSYLVSFNDDGQITNIFDSEARKSIYDDQSVINHIENVLRLRYCPKDRPSSEPEDTVTPPQDAAVAGCPAGTTEVPVEDARECKEPSNEFQTDVMTGYGGNPFRSSGYDTAGGERIEYRFVATTPKEVLVGGSVPLKIKTCVDKGDNPSAYEGTGCEYLAIGMKPNARVMSTNPRVITLGPQDYQHGTQEYFHEFKCLAPGVSKFSISGTWGGPTTKSPNYIVETSEIACVRPCTKCVEKKDEVSGQTLSSYITGGEKDKVNQTGGTHTSAQNINDYSFQVYLLDDNGNRLSDGKGGNLHINVDYTGFLQHAAAVCAVDEDKETASIFEFIRKAFADGNTDEKCVGSILRNTEVKYTNTGAAQLFYARLIDATADAGIFQGAGISEGAMEQAVVTSIIGGIDEMVQRVELFDEAETGFVPSLDHGNRFVVGSIVPVDVLLKYYEIKERGGKRTEVKGVKVSPVALVNAEYSSYPKLISKNQDIIAGGPRYVRPGVGHYFPKEFKCIAPGTTQLAFYGHVEIKGRNIDKTQDFDILSAPITCYKDPAQESALFIEGVLKGAADTSEKHDFYQAAYGDVPTSIRIYILGDDGEPIKDTEGRPRTISVSTGNLLEQYAAGCSEDEDKVGPTSWLFVPSAHASNANLFVSGQIDSACMMNAIREDNRLPAQSANTLEVHVDDTTEDDGTITHEMLFGPLFRRDCKVVEGDLFKYFSDLEKNNPLVEKFFKNNKPPYILSINSGKGMFSVTVNGKGQITHFAEPGGVSTELAIEYLEGILKMDYCPKSFHVASIPGPTKPLKPAKPDKPSVSLSGTINQIYPGISDQATDEDVEFTGDYTQGYGSGALIGMDPETGQLLDEYGNTVRQETGNFAFSSNGAGSTADSGDVTLSGIKLVLGQNLDFTVDSSDLTVNGVKLDTTGARTTINSDGTVTMPKPTLTHRNGNLGEGLYDQHGNLYSADGSEIVAFANAFTGDGEITDSDYIDFSDDGESGTTHGAGTSPIDPSTIPAPLPINYTGPIDQTPPGTPARDGYKYVCARCTSPLSGWKCEEVPIKEAPTDENPTGTSGNDAKSDEADIPSLPIGTRIRF